MADPTLTRQYGNEGLGALRRFFSQLPQAATNWPRQAWDFGRLPADIAMAAIKQGRLGTLSPEEDKLDQASQDAAYGAMMNGLPPAPRMTALPAAHGADRFARGTPERSAEQVAEFANPLFFGSPLRAISSIPAALRHGAEEFAHAASPAYVVKPKGGNWLNGSVENALQGLKKEVPELIQPNIADQRNVVVNSWIDGPLTKYVKNRMASPDDEVRRLAEQGVLHYDPGSSVDRLTTTLARNNRWTGHAITDQTPTELTGISQLGRLWEQVSDAAVEPKRVGDTFRSFMRGSPDEAWLSKVPDDSVVYRMVDAFPQEAFSPHLGFNHLIDELTNALNPASGLPQHLQLTPEAVKNMSMEKAVRRVADINDWRAANLAEHNRQLAEQASLVRDYPHSDAMPNPRGLRWVELKKGEVPTEGNIDALYSADEAAKKALADQLKYEGDTMGHCVGGYCDNVLSGRSRIFSLRDAKGEPHVTVEVQPKWNNKMGDGSATEDAIVQIKGKQNKKPNDEYLPFVQDFVKNPPHGQPWGDVGDLQNTGLRNLKTLGDEPLVKAAREKLGDYATHEEWDTFGNEFLKNKRGFASGGPVTQKDSHPAQNIQGIIAAIREYHAHA